MQDDAAFESLFTEIAASDGADSLRLAIARLETVDKLWLRGNPAAIVAAADRVLAVVDVEAVSAYFGVLHDNDPDDTDADALVAHKKFVEQKAIIADALFRKCKYVCMIAHVVSSLCCSNILSYRMCDRPEMIMFGRQAIAHNNYYGI